MASTEDPSPPSVVLQTQTSPPLTQRIIGKRSHASGKLDDFRGIPFGSIPARWKYSDVRRSLPSDIFYAVKNGPKCPQLSEANTSEGAFNATIPFPSDVTESELDCLNLFIVRPSKEALSQRGCDPDTPLPVFTWIHGGAYGFGAGTDPMWDPSNLVLQALELGTPFMAVYLNYRVGIFGFAATSAMIEAQSPGEMRGVNFGLRDQNVGLKWIATNISAFGGDSQRITIAGQSAGGNSVHVHALEAKKNWNTPLFQKTILQSGAVGTCGPVSLASAEAQWDRLCNVLGVAKEDKNEEFAAMQRTTAEELVQASRKLFWFVFPLVNDQLTLEFDESLNPHRISLDTWPKRVARDDTPVDVLLGEADNEAYVIHPQVKAFTSFEGIQEAFSSSTVDNEIVKRTLHLYELTPEASLDALKSGLYRFLSEVQFSFPLFKAFETFSANDTPEESGLRKTAARRYKVDFGNPFSDGPCSDIYGISHHCVDMIYQFNAFPAEILKADRLLKPSEVPNDLLRQHVQKDWIDFIVGQGQSTDEDTVVHYGKDRVKLMVKASEDQFFTDQAARFAFLGEFVAETRLLVGAINGGPALGMNA